MKRVVVIGLGIFGSQLARQLYESGLEVVEQRLRRMAGQFSFGDTPGLADCVLVPQIFNAQRFNCDLAAYPRSLAMAACCANLEAFQRAKGAAQ